MVLLGALSGLRFMLGMTFLTAPTWAPQSFPWVIFIYFLNEHGSLWAIFWIPGSSQPDTGLLCSWICFLMHLMGAPIFPWSNLPNCLVYLLFQSQPLPLPPCSLTLVPFMLLLWFLCFRHAFFLLLGCLFFPWEPLVWPKTQLRCCLLQEALSECHYPRSPFSGRPLHFGSHRTTSSMFVHICVFRLVSFFS